MEESGEYRVTHHRGRDPDNPDATVIFRHHDESRAMTFYQSCTPPARGTVVALWRPDGSLIAFTAG